jgi:hypothetical protein
MQGMVCASGILSHKSSFTDYTKLSLPRRQVRRLDVVPRQHPTNVTEGHAEKWKEDNQDQLLHVQENSLQWINSLSDLQVTTPVLPEGGPVHQCGKYSTNQNPLLGWDKL